ncbi:MAG: aminotransferase class I/II-fold pyridoxal phosphate-dependent enzyme [Cyanobacteria bacterium P01_H01_bin.121]
MTADQSQTQPHSPVINVAIVGGFKVAQAIQQQQSFDYYRLKNLVPLTAGLLNVMTMADEQAYVQIADAIATVAQHFYPHQQTYDYNAADPYYKTQLTTGYRHFFHCQDLPADSVFFGCGSADLFKTLLSFVLPAGVIIGPALQYPEYVDYIRASGRQYLGVFTPKHSFPTQGILDGIDQHQQTCAAVLLDRPSNPTGQVVSVAELVQILQAAATAKILVIVDEAYANYMPVAESAVNLLGQHQNLVLLRSNAKAYGIGSMRVGFLAFGSPAIAAQFAKVQTPFCPDLFAVEFANYLFQQGDTFLDPLRYEIQQQKAELQQRLMRLGFTCLPSHASISILMLHLPGHHLREEFQREGVMIRDDSAYNAMLPAIDESYARLRVPLTSERRDRLIAAAARVAA